MPMAPDAARPDESLKRLGGGRWETADARFTIEPASGTWSVVDAEETDDLGLPLVRGPFRSLTDAKAAIADARTSAPPSSSLAAKGKRAPAAGDAGERDAKPGGRGRRAAATTDEDEAASTGPRERPRRTGQPAGRDRDAGRAKSRPEQPTAGEPEDPGWFRDLSPSDRGRARRLIERLTAAGTSDATSIVRRDLVGGVPALAAHAIERRLAQLPADAGLGSIAELLADGRDDELGVRWRIVDGDGRPILIEPPKGAGRR